MELKIEGNPGTGNTFQEIRIGTVQNFNPNATSVVNNNFGDYHKVKEDPFGTAAIASIRKEILDYVGRTRNLVEDRWRDGYMDLWEDILDLDVVAAEVYDRGRQKGTVFNRKLVANIICCLGNFRSKDVGLFGAYSPTPIVKELEGNIACSTRTELGSQPEPKIRNAIRQLLKEKYALDDVF